ncbi:MAG: PEGA domain-containing protein [Patescibacteria group bacterium]
MRKTTRQLLFYFFAGAFLISAPLLVLYTAGYRISLNNYRVLETGAIAVSTTPKGASITVNEKTASNKSPTVVQNVLPQTVPVRLTKNGYIPWQDSVKVSPGQTTYVTSILYADETAEAVSTFPGAVTAVKSFNGRYIGVIQDKTSVDGGTEVSLYDVIVKEEKFLTALPKSASSYTLAFSPETSILVILQDGIPITGFTVNAEQVSTDTLRDALQSSAPVKIIDNGKNVEVRSSKGTNDLLALLPEGTYEVLTADDEYLVLRDSRKTITIVSLSGSNVVTLDVPAQLWAWLPDSHLLAWSDGIEVNTYDAVNRTRTFLTRQSDLIQSLMWHPTGGAVIFGTASRVTSLDLEGHESRVSTPLLISQGSITSAWIDKTGKTLYTLQTVNGVPTLYRRKLVK